MISRWIDWCAQNRFLVFMGTLLLVLSGIWTLRHIPLDALPDISDVEVIIHTPWAGQPPSLIEDQVTYPIVTTLLAAPLTMNAAILRAEIAKSYEEFLEIFDKFYADDVEVTSEGSPETIRGKQRVRPFLLNFLVPLHVMAEVAGLSMSVQLTQVPRDSSNETHFEWRIDFTGVGGRRCTLKWYAIRGWAGPRVVYEHHYGHEQIGGPLTEDDLNFNWGRSEVEFQSPS